MQAGARESTRQWWTTTLSSRKEEHTAVVVIGSRQHPDDLYNHLLESDNFTSIVENYFKKKPSYILNGYNVRVYKSAPEYGLFGLGGILDSKLFRGVENESFYFVHSYAAKDPVNGAANTISNYGEDFLAAVEKDFIDATQFHPAKSGAAGAKLISNWVKSL